MPRKTLKQETRVFMINQLRAIASSRKVHASIRLRCLDRIAVIEKYYDLRLSDFYGPSVNAKANDLSEFDKRVEEMLDKLKGGENGELSEGSAG